MRKRRRAQEFVPMDDTDVAFAHFIERLMSRYLDLHFTFEKYPAHYNVQANDQWIAQVTTAGGGQGNVYAYSNSRDQFAYAGNVLSNEISISQFDKVLGPINRRIRN